MAEDMFQVDVDESRGRAVLTVRCDRVDMINLDRLEGACRQLLESGQSDLLIDARKMHFVTSTFIAVAVKTSQEAEGQGRKLAVVAGALTANTFHQFLADLVEIRSDLDE